MVSYFTNASNGTKMLRQKEKHFSRREKVHGQFLTPPEVASFIIDFLLTNNVPKLLGIDPSCGDGVFLQVLFRSGFESVIGIDNDSEILNKVPSEVKQQVTILIDDGLAQLALAEGSASVVVGNPPFSAKYDRVNSERTLSCFQLGRKRKSQAIEILFLERFLQLSSPNGAIGIILPQGVFSALPLNYVRSFVMERANVFGIVSLPRGIFTNGTSSKTNILFAQKGKQLSKAFMGIARHLNDLPRILEAYVKGEQVEQPPAFWVNLDFNSFEPEFYWACRTAKWLFKEGLPIVSLGELISEVHSGATEYGNKRQFADKGIPFISAKTVTPFGVDLSRDKKYIVPNSAMDKERAYVRPGDIVFVRVGVGCSGRAAIILDSLQKAVADDWIYIMRTGKISPFYLVLFLQSRLGQCQVNPLKRGVGTVTIPQSLLKTVLVPLPPKSFQEAVEAGYKEMVRLREAGCLADAAEKFRALLFDIETIVGGNNP